MKDKSWRSTYKEVSRGHIRNVFNKYKTCLLISREGVSQKVTVSYDNVSVQGGQAKGIEDRIIKKCDADLYIKEIDSILQTLPGFYKKIMIESFIRDKSDISIYVDLEIPRRTYYYMKNESVKIFVDEYLTRRINI